MKGRILVVEDEVELAELIQLYLEKEGIDTEICGDAETALRRVGEESYDLVVLDINLPDMDGFEFLQAVRPRFSAPIIIVSARETDEDIIMGLSSGADEFVTKPFTPRVLVARIRALLRRSRTKGHQDLTFGPYAIDLDGYFLRKGENRIVLSSKEFEVLRHLIRNAGRAMTPNEIYTEVWENQYGDSTSVAVYIRRIRQKLESNPREPEYIQTIHGKGYRFNPEVIDHRSLQ